MKLKYSFLILFLIIFISGIFMIIGAKNDSLIMDELPHIPAGYSYIKKLDYRLNPEHPPLLKTLAALPLLGFEINFPINDKSWMNDINGQWDFGRVFFYDSKNNADKIIFLARIFPIILTLFTTIIIYIWAKKLIREKWALLPASLFAFSPTVIAHGHYVTTDIAAAFGALIALFSFTSFIDNPSYKKIVIAGIFMGIAQLMKFSNVLLFPFFAFLIIVFYVGKKINKNKIINEPTKNFIFYCKSYLMICLISFITIYGMYFLVTFNYPVERQISDTSYILNSFPNKFAAETVIKMAGNIIFRPIAHYLLGVMMVIQRSTGGNTGYFLGEISNSGWWYYFPTVFFLKESIPSLIIILTALFTFLFYIKKEGQNIKKYFNKYFDQITMFFFIFLYWIWSMKSPLNIGVRHLLPTIPFLYVLSSIQIKKIIENPPKILLKKIILSGILVWYILEVFIATPFFLSYFNEFAGGTKNGYRFVTDSNYDWGQDLKRLQEWQQKNNENKKIAIDYFGGDNIFYRLGTNAIPWNSEMGNPKKEDIEWIAISVNTLTQAFAKKASGFERNVKDEYTFIRERNKNFKEGLNAIPTPDAKAGTSIFLYHL